MEKPSELFSRSSFSSISSGAFMLSTGWGVELWLSFRINSTCTSSSKTSRCKGKLTVKRLPTPGWLSTVIVPWCISTISFTKDNPMPEEGCRIFCLTNDSKRWNKECCFSTAIPIPSSATSISIVLSFVVILTVIDLSAGVYLNALESRLKNIFSNLSLSTQLYTDWMVEVNW